MNKFWRLKYRYAHKINHDVKPNQEMINGISRQINTTVAKIKKNRIIGPSNVSKEIWALLDEADQSVQQYFWTRRRD